MNANRQSADYLNASAEWAAYQSALSAGYALVHGNPDHTKMFACVSSPDAPTTPIRPLRTLSTPLLRLLTQGEAD